MYIYIYIYVCNNIGANHNGAMMMILNMRLFHEWGPYDATDALFAALVTQFRCGSTIQKGVR